MSNLTARAFAFSLRPVSISVCAHTLFSLWLSKTHTCFPVRTPWPCFCHTHVAVKALERLVAGLDLNGNLKRVLVSRGRRLDAYFQIAQHFRGKKVRLRVSSRWLFVENVV